MSIIEFSVLLFKNNTCFLRMTTSLVVWLCKLEKKKKKAQIARWQVFKALHLSHTHTCAHTHYLRATAITPSLQFITPLRHTHAHMQMQVDCCSPTYLHTHTHTVIIPLLISIPLAVRSSPGWSSRRVEAGCNCPLRLLSSSGSKPTGSNTTSLPLRCLSRPWLIPPGTVEGWAEWRKGKLQSSADLEAGRGQIAIRNGFSGSTGLMDVLGFWRV